MTSCSAKLKELGPPDALKLYLKREKCAVYLEFILSIQAYINYFNRKIFKILKDHNNNFSKTTSFSFRTVAIF